MFFQNRKNLQVVIVLSALVFCLVMIAGCGETKVSKQQKEKDAKQVAELLAKKVEEQEVAKPQVESLAVSETAKLEQKQVEPKSEVVAQNQASVPQSDTTAAKMTISEDVTIDRVKSETSEALAVAEAFLRQQEQKYHTKIDTELSEFRSRVAKLQTKAESAAQSAKKKVSQQLSELRTQMSSTGSQLGDFNKKSETELGQLSKELEELLSVLETKSADIETKSLSSDTQEKKSTKASS